MQSGDGAMERPGHGRIDDIEVLRAFAVGLVLLQHGPWNLIPWQFVDQGPLFSRFAFWSGVDLFFAISGFVIARSLLPELAAAPERRTAVRITLAFWIRRAWRLLPTAWLWLAVMVALAAGFNRSGAFQPLAANLEGAAAALVNLANIRLFHAMAQGAPGGVTAIYWTLSLEEQFYLLLPLVALVTGRRLAPVIAAVALAQLFIDRTHGHFLLNLTRSDGLALGVLLAIWSRRPSYRRAEPAVLGRGVLPILVPAAFLVAFAWVTGPRCDWSVKIGALAVMSAAAVWAASYDRGYVLPAGRVKDALCWVGARSYAVYLIHLPIYHATVELWWRLKPEVLKPSPAHFALLVATALPTTFVLAELNYRCVETPLRRRGARIAARVAARRAPELPAAAAAPAR